MMNRYSRQELFSAIGREGQAKIRAARVAIIGCGALGSLQAETLTRAGTGTIYLLDRDFVEPVNLQRQALFTEEDAQRVVPKAVAAADHLKQINSEVEVVSVVTDFSADNMADLPEVDLLLDGTDNFQTRYLLNDVAWKRGVPWIYGACVAASGVSCAFVPPAFPCLRCLFESEPPVGSGPTCDTAGILWPAVGAVVSWQIAAAFRILTGAGLTPRLYQCDIWEGRHHVVSLEKAKRSDCLTCAAAEYPSLKERSDQETSLCGRDAIQIKPRAKAALDLDAVVSRWRNLGETQRNPFLAKLLLPEHEIVLFPDGRAIVKGTHDPARARDLYAKYVGA